MTDLYIVGQDIPAGNPVIRYRHDGKLYTPPCVAGIYVGDAVENLREGFRAAGDGGVIREDDA